MKTSPKQAVRVDLIDWLHPGVRISNAMYLMQTTDLSVTQVACDVGFVDMLAFEREFKKYTLMTSKEFKTRSTPD